MKSPFSNRVPSALLALLFAIAGCAQIPDSDNATTDGSSAGKALTKTNPKHPARGVMPVHRGQTAMTHGPINTSAPSGAHLAYFGGRVVSNMQVVQVLWGAGSYLPEVQRTSSPSIATFYQGILNSPYVDMFSEYNTPASGGTKQTIGRGSFLSQVQIKPSKTGTAIANADIQAELGAQIAAGKLPAPTTDAAGNNNTYYAIFFPHGVSITNGTSASCVQFCAYHGTVASAAGHEIYYGVHPDMQTGSGCEGGCGSDPTPFNNYTSVASHEMSETITDCEVGLATTQGPPLAWYDNANGENGDICNAQQGPMTGSDGVSYTVQAEFSNTANDCIYSSKATPPPPPPAADFSLSTSPASQTVAVGGSTSFTVSSAATNGFNGKIQLAVSGLPSGATSTLTGNPAGSGGAALAIATDNTIAAGSYALTITGTSGSLSHTTAASLVVTGSTSQPDFSLTADASVTIGAGQSGSVNLSASASGGFASDVALSVSGAPAGATATFNPTAIAGGSGAATLSIAASASAAAGTTTLTITGTSGSLSHSANFDLTIAAVAPAADFSVAISPASVAIDPGASATAAVSVAGSNGFADSVTLSASGAPAGTTVTFDTATVSGSGSANLTVTASAAAPAGTYAITVTGTTATLSHTAALSLTINRATPPPPPPAPGTVFSDDVENGDLGWTAYADNPRDPIWKIEQTAASHSGSHRWRSNPGRNYANNTGSYLISPSFSLAGYASSTLSFFYKFHTEDKFDFFFVWVSTDDGQSWTQVAQGTGVSHGWNGWAPQASIDLTPFVGSGTVRIAYSIQSDGSVTSWGAAVDDILVTAQ